MGTQHITETVTPVLHRRSVIDATPVEMLEAQHGNVKGIHFERSYQCTKCQREFRASQVMLIDGQPYCMPYRHYVDKLHDLKIKEEY